DAGAADSDINVCDVLIENASNLGRDQNVADSKIQSQMQQDYHLLQLVISWNSIARSSS
ncbi:hypothetical protein ACJMK2_027105, partial [Sinanodonta woodiana]